MTETQAGELITLVGQLVTLFTDFRLVFARYYVLMEVVAQVLGAYVLIRLLWVLVVGPSIDITFAIVRKVRSH